ARDPRHLPRPGLRARLRGRVPRREGHGERGRRARPDPGRDDARDRRRPAAPAQGGGRGGGVNRYWPLLLLLASVWGASYLFIKVAVDGGFEPAPLMCSRAAIGAAILCGYLART